MNNDELKKKISQIISEYCCPYGKTHKQLYGDDRMCYSKMNFAECNPITECTDALIAAGIGDVETVQNISASATAMAVLEAAQAEHRAEVYKRALHIAHTAGEFAYYVDKAEKELAEENSGKKKI